MPYKDIEKRKEFFRQRYLKNLAFVRDFKLKSGCVDCGYKEHHAALEFDHVKPRKRGTVSQQLGKSLKVIKEEIENCEVVCANCHQIRTWARNGNSFYFSSLK